MTYTTNLPIEPGIYNHRWIDKSGAMREQTLFVGWVDATKPKMQGRDRPKYNFAMKCCKQDEVLHADRLTPKEWGGFWENERRLNPNNYCNWRWMS